jgi:FAD:protein FMN transferase
MLNKLILAAGLCLSLAACFSGKRETIRLTGEAQGSTYSIIYIDDQKRNFQPQIDSIFKMIDESMSTWLPNSLISRLNSGDKVLPDPHFSNVLAASYEVHKNSGGFFDPTIGPLVKAWGFSFNSAGPVPSEDAIAILKEVVGLDKIQWASGDSIQLPLSQMSLDFNAIAQGYTVDLLCEFFSLQGVTDYMVEVGGELRTSGLNADQKSWRIGIDKPVAHAEGRPLQVILKMSDIALATSGSYRKFRMEDGVRYAHAINPKSGRPVTHSLLSVSVIANSAMVADAYATVFLILGVEASLELANQLELEAYFISDSASGTFDISMTEGFKKYILEDVFE